MGVGGQRHASAAILPRKNRYPTYRWLVGPQGRSGRVRKISPPAAIRSPHGPTRSESLYRLSYPDPTYSVRHWTNFRGLEIIKSIFNECARTRACSFRCFGKIAKSDYSLRHVCPSVCMGQLGSHCMDFHEIWYLSIFRKSVEKIQVALKSGKNNGHFT